MLLFAHGSAFAEPGAAERETARTLMDAGDEAFDRGDAKAALRAYEGAHAIMNVPTTGAAVARAREALGLLVEARDVALSVTRMTPTPSEPAVFAEARHEAQKLAESLQARIPTLKLRITGVAKERVRVTINQEPLSVELIGLPRKLNPGRYRVVARADGYKDAAAEIELDEGEHETAELRLVPTGAVGNLDATGEGNVPTDEPEPASATSPLVPIGFGIAGAGLLVGSFAGVMSWSKTNSIESECNAGRCPSSQSDELDSAQTLATISNVGFAVALVGTAIGIYGVLGSDPQHTRSSTRVELMAGARFVGVRGGF